MQVSGSSIKLGSDAALGAPAQFLACPTPYGISSASACWRRGVLAFAEKGLRPAIYVHSYPSLKRVAKLEGEPTARRPAAPPAPAPPAQPLTATRTPHSPAPLAQAARTWRCAR